MTDNLTRFLGSAVLVLGIATLVVLGAANTEPKPVLLVPVFFICAGAFIANRANS